MRNEKEKKSHRERELARYQRNKSAAIEQLGSECVNCGSKEDLEFDHIDPNTKSFNISSMWSVSPERREKELKKCQLLCRNCHDEKTFGEIRRSRKHGTHAMYKRGKCRCEVCRDFFESYRREWRRKTGRVSSNR